MQTNKAQQKQLLESTQQIVIPLGNTIAERMATVQAIKDAMADAILLNVELDIKTINKENAEVYNTFYREANLMQHYLKQL